MDEAGAPIVNQEEGGGLGAAAVAKALPAAGSAVVGIVFAIQNLDSIDVDFLIWSFELPLVVIIVLSALLGGALWQLGLVLRRRRRS